MAKSKLLCFNCVKLFFFIILNFGQIPNSSGIDYYRGNTCKSLTSTATTSVRCLYNGTPLKNCENPVNGTTVSVLCLYAGYSLQLYPIPVCTNRQWSPFIPQCYPVNSAGISAAIGQSNSSPPQIRPYSTCSSLTSSISTNFKCKHDGKSLKNCQAPIDGTTVLISCNSFYEESSLQINPIRFCKNGKWSSSIPKCYQSSYVEPSTTSERSYPVLSSQATVLYHRNCQSLISTTSTNVRCAHSSRSLPNCQNPADGTIVFISCNPQYEEFGLQNNPTRVCRGGNWSSSIPQCTSIYGKPSYTSAEKLIPSLSNQASHYSACPSLTSSTSTNIRCIVKGKFVSNCENAANGTIAFISCNAFYQQPTLQNNPTRTCKDGKWSSSIPECYPIYGEVPSEAVENSNPSRDIQSSVCPSLTSSTSTSFKCILNEKRLNNCQNAINGTIVVIACNNFYEESSNQNNSIRICRNGKWSSSIPQCNPICGKPFAKMFGASNQLLGNNNSPHHYPWHVGIYNSYSDEYLCGGTIINQKLILTAAHCVTDKDGNLKQQNNYLLSAGKYYRNYADTRDKYAQYSEVSQIHIPRGYKGESSYQTFDIAVLVLNTPFALSIAVQPVCLDIYEETSNLFALLDNPGIVTGWGRLDIGRPFSEVLKQLLIQYVPFRQCYQEVHESLRSYITSDKICGSALINGSNICSGDGGGGLVFKNVVDERYYIRGIASVGFFSSGNCYSSQYAVYTLVSRHIEFLKSLIESNN